MGKDRLPGLPAWINFGGMTLERFDLTIVGGGPVGLFGAAMAGLHGMRTQIIESLPELGGQLTALYPEKQVYDVAGFPAVAAADLAKSLIDQALRYDPDVHVNETVEQLEALPDGGYRLQTGTGTRETTALLITAGIGAFMPRKIPAQGADRFEGQGVYYIPPSLATFRGLNVVVVGGGDTAVDWAREMAAHARRVTLIHRRREFRAQPGSLEALLDHAAISVKTPYEIEAVEGGKRVEAVVLKNQETGETETLPTEAVVSGLGFHAQLGAIKGWGLNFAGNAIEVNPASLETNRPGIFAAGDIAAYPGKVKLIATGFGEVGIAMGPIRTRVFPHLKGALPHSTNLPAGKSREVV